MKQQSDKRRRPLSFAVNDLVLLSTVHLRVKDVPTKFQKRFVGPFKVVAKVGKSAYTLQLPETWKIHPTFHVSLLKRWQESVFTAGGPVDPQDIPFVLDEGEELWETQKLLRWRWRRHGNRRTREFLVLWKGRPLHEASWVPEEKFTDADTLEADIEEDQPEEAEAV